VSEPSISSGSVAIQGTKNFSPAPTAAYSVVDSAIPDRPRQVPSSVAGSELGSSECYDESLAKSSEKSLCR
jgi:hypothetical protein